LILIKPRNDNRGAVSPEARAKPSADRPDRLRKGAVYLFTLIVYL